MIFFTMLVGIHGASWCSEGRNWKLFQYENIAFQKALNGDFGVFVSNFDLWQRTKKEQIARVLEWKDEKKIEKAMMVSKNTFMQKLALTIAAAKTTGYAYEEKCLDYLNEQGLDLHSGLIGYPQNGGVALVSKTPPKEGWLISSTEIIKGSIQFITRYQEMPITPLLVALWRGKQKVASFLVEQIGESEIHPKTAEAYAAFAIIRRCYPVLEMLLKKSPQLFQDAKIHDILKRLACMRLSVPAMIIMSKTKNFEPQTSHFDHGIQAHYEVSHGITALPNFFSINRNRKPLVQGFTIKGKIIKTEYNDLAPHLEMQKHWLNQLIMQEAAEEKTYFVQDASVCDIFRGYENIVEIVMAKRKKQFDQWQQAVKDTKDEQLKLESISCLICKGHVWLNSVKLCLSQDCAMRNPRICDNHVFQRDEAIQKYGCSECKQKNPIDYNYIGFRLNQETVKSLYTSNK